MAALLQVVVGHFNGILMTDQQPMKMASADAVFDTKEGAGLSLFAVGDFKSNPEGLNRNVEIPNLLSWVSTGYPRGEIQGINDINAQYRQKYGPGEYAPIVAVVYWTWRAMIGSGVLMFLLGACGLVARPDGPAGGVAALPALVGPRGRAAVHRQPDRLDVHRDGPPALGRVRAAQDRPTPNSPSVSAAEVWITLVGFTLLYGVLAAIAARIFLKLARKGPEAEGAAQEPGHELALAY